jgi:hypothetical protein
MGGWQSTPANLRGVPFLLLSRDAALLRELLERGVRNNTPRYLGLLAVAFTVVLLMRPRSRRVAAAVLAVIAVGMITIVMGCSESSSAPTEDARNAGPALLPVEGQLVLDLGTKVAGELVDATFHLYNSADAPVRVQPVGASCECTRLDFSKSVIPPGEDVDVLMQAALPLRAGEFGVVADFLETLPGGGSLRRSLTLHGLIQGRVYLFCEPERVELEAREESLRARFNVVARSEDPGALLPSPELCSAPIPGSTIEIADSTDTVLEDGRLQRCWPVELLIARAEVAADEGVLRFGLPDRPRLQAGVRLIAPEREASSLPKGR